MKICRKGLHEYSDDKRQCPECAREGMRIYNKNNKEKCNSMKKEWKKNNKEKVKLGNDIYLKENADKIKKRIAEYRLNNASKLKERRANFYVKKKKKKKVYSIMYRTENKKKIIEYNAKYYEKNKERITIRNNAWILANPESRKLRNHTRRAKVKQVGGVLSKDIGERLFKLQKGICPCCRMPLGKDYHLDHIVPIALGGSNTDDNIQLLRKSCNFHKNRKHPIDFMQSKGFLL